MCASGSYDLCTACITELFNKFKTTSAKCVPFPHGIKHLKIQFIFRLKKIVSSKLSNQEECSQKSWPNIIHYSDIFT